MKLFLFIFFFLSSSAFAAGVHSCENLDSIGNLVGNVKTYAEGQIRVAYVSTEEPVAAPDHLLVFVYSEPMSMMCFAVSADADGHGFGGIDMEQIHSSYDSEKGLLLSVP